jgi:hypothetical protein
MVKSVAVRAEAASFVVEASGVEERLWLLLLLQPLASGRFLWPLHLQWLAALFVALLLLLATLPCALQAAVFLKLPRGLRVEHNVPRLFGKMPRVSIIDLSKTIHAW